MGLCVGWMNEWACTLQKSIISMYFLLCLHYHFVLWEFSIRYILRALCPRCSSSLWNSIILSSRQTWVKSCCCGCWSFLRKLLMWNATFMINQRGQLLSSIQPCIIIIIITTKVPCAFISSHLSYLYIEFSPLSPDICTGWSCFDYA